MIVVVNTVSGIIGPTDDADAWWIPPEFLTATPSTPAKGVAGSNTTARYLKNIMELCNIVGDTSIHRYVPIDEATWMTT